MSQLPFTQKANDVLVSAREKAIQGVFSFVAIDDDKRPVPVLPGFVD